MQHRDIPIQKDDEDKLKFKEFASRVSQSILNYEQTDTLIFSIEGEWGSGKTSLMNLIQNGLLNDNVVIVNFKPWLATSIHQMFKLFFNELEQAVRQLDISEEQLADDIKKFASIVMPDTITIKAGWLKAKYDMKPKETQDDTIEKLRKNIDNVLKKLGKKIVIIVDDIDRLTDEETEFIFRLTKGIADFNNLIYILLYDKPVVAKALEKFKSENGERYLEKIVQYSLSVPKPHTSNIQKLLFDSLNSILSKVEKDGCRCIFQEQRWFYVQELISTHFKTLRDINRLINIISFEYPIICEDVNFVDFFLLSIIKLKHNELYETIRTKPKDFFIDNTHMIYDKDNEVKRITDSFKTKNDFHNYKDILSIMFPIIGGRTNIQEFRHKEKRISDSYYFDNYFAYTVADDKLSMAEYNEVMDSVFHNEYTNMQKVFTSLDNENKLNIFLSMFQQLDIDDLSNIEDDVLKKGFLNLLKASEELSFQQKGHFSSAYKWGIENKAFKIILKHSDFENFIIDFVKNNIEYKLIQKLSLLEYINKKANEHYFTNNDLPNPENALGEISKTLKNKLEASTLDSLINSEEPSYIVGNFKKVDASLDSLISEVKDEILQSKEKFFEIVVWFKYTRNISSTNKGDYKKDAINKEALGLLVSIEDLNKYVEELNENSLTPEQKSIIEVWNNGDKW